MHDKIERKFPSFFNNFTLPDGAADITLTAYRACPTNRLEIASFLPTFVEWGSSGLDISNPGNYAMSVSEKPNGIRRFAVMNKVYNKPLIIAKGITAPCCGPAQRTRERTKNKDDGSHIDWWLYEDALPHEHFELIDDFARYYEEYKREASA